MDVTIIKDDNMLGVDGLFVNVDLTGLPSNFHALQWNGTVGDVEWNDGTLNTVINSIDEYQAYIDLYTSACTKVNALAENPYYGMTADEELVARKADKRAEINEAFGVAAVMDITLNGITYFGGKESAHDLKGSYDLLLLKGATTMLIVNASSVSKEYTLAEAIMIIAAIAEAYQAVLFNKHSKYLLIDAITSDTLAELDAITWE